MGPQDASSRPIAARVLQTIQTELRPLVQAHGGDVFLTDLTGGDVEVAYGGACRNCPVKPVTHVALVERLLLEVPGVTSVEAPEIRISNAALERVRKAVGSSEGSESESAIG